MPSYAKNWMVLLLGIFSFLCLQTQGLGATRELARACLACGEYAAAEVLWLRVEHFGSDSGQYEVSAALAEIAFQTDRFAEAVEGFDYAARLAPSEGLKIECIFRLAAAGLQVQAFERVRSKLEAIGPLYESLAEHRRQFYLGSAAYGMADFVMAEGYWGGCTDGPLELGELHQLFAQNARLERQHPKLPIALSLILPGLGQLWNGKPGRVLNSVLLLGVIAAGGIYIGAVVGIADALVFVFPTFARYYIGGALRAGKDAESKLQERRDDLLRQMLDLVGH